MTNNAESPGIPHPTITPWCLLSIIHDRPSGDSLLSDDLNAYGHVNNGQLLAVSLYATRVLKSRGLPPCTLHEGTRTTTVARLLYAAPA